MFLIYVLILFLFELINICYGSMRIVNCTDYDDPDRIANLSTNEYVMFETTNYPLNEYEYADHENKFIRTDNESNIWFVFLNGHINYFYITGVAGNNNDDFDTKEYLWNTPPPWFSVIIPYSSLVFRTTDMYHGKGKWFGFQSFVYAPNSIELSSCPLNGKTFILKDYLDIIPITSAFNSSIVGSLTNITKKCSWNLEIPSLFKLKINIKYIYSTSKVFLTITIDDNNTEIPINSAVGVQYFDGKIFSINYGNGINNIDGISFEFGGLVSAVETNPILNNQSCYKNLTENGAIMMFGNYNEIMGYENNEICEIKILVNPSSTFQISYFGYLENGIDTVTAIGDLGKVFDISQNQNWIIDEKVSDATLNFSSDGSILSGGFQVNITELSCECSNSTQIFSCESEVHFFNVFKDGGFCSGVNCNFTLTSDPKCGNYSSLLILKGELRYFAKDSFKIYENGKLIANITGDTPLTNNYLFNPKSKITINFMSDKTFYGIYQNPLVLFGAANLNTTPFVINLSPENFTYSLDFYTMARSFFTVHVPESYTLDLYVLKNIVDLESDLDLQNTFLYDSNSTDNFVGTLLDLPLHIEYNLMRFYTSKSNSLTIFRAYYSVNFSAFTMFFRLRERNSQTVSTWPRLFFYGISNSFIIPAHAYLKFTSEFYLKIDFFGTFNNPSGYQDYNLNKGIYSSKTFSNPWTNENSTLQIHVSNDTTCRLTIKFLDLSQNASLNITLQKYIPTDDLPLRVTQLNQTFDFTTIEYPDEITIYINLQEPIIGHRGYVIEFEMLPTANSNMNSISFLFLSFIYFIF